MSTELALTTKDLEPIKQRFIELVDERTYMREASFALQAMGSNAYLAKSTKASLQMAVLNVAQIGLSLNPALKQAYLVPRRTKKGDDWVVEANLMPSYQGLVKLITDAGTVKNISAHLIWEGDDCEIDMASARKVERHKPYVLTGKPKGELKGVYSLATLNDGTREIEVMTRDEVYAIRERSESWKNRKEGMPTIWATDEGEMVRKTVIRRHFKYLPKSGNFERALEAIKIDEADYEMSAAQVGMIESLLNTAVISEDEKSTIDREINSMSGPRASQCISYLMERQPKDGFAVATEKLRAGK